jgi:alanine dehydrogenase
MIGVPKEIKKFEYRVGMTPSKVQDLTRQGIKIMVEKDAGLASGYDDDDYIKSGAIVSKDNAKIYAECDFIVKVKAPEPLEYSLLREDQVIFSFFHFAAQHSTPLLHNMKEAKVVCVEYETIPPILSSMSEIAGRLAIQQGMKYLEKPMGGNGVLLCGSGNVMPGNVIIIGGGVVGFNAAILAANIGAHVFILEKKESRTSELKKFFKNHANVEVIHIEDDCQIDAYIEIADIMIGCINKHHGDRTPKIITTTMLSRCKKGSVFIDMTIDQGGMTEVSIPTTHDHPIYSYNDVLFNCIENMASVVPMTSSTALSRASYPYIEAIAKDGWNYHPSILQAVRLASGKLI